MWLLLELREDIFKLFARELEGEMMWYWLGMGAIMLIAYALIRIEEKIND